MPKFLRQGNVRWWDRVVPLQSDCLTRDGCRYYNNMIASEKKIMPFLIKPLRQILIYLQQKMSLPDGWNVSLMFWDITTTAFTLTVLTLSLTLLTLTLTLPTLTLALFCQILLYWSDCLMLALRHWDHSFALCCINRQPRPLT